MFIRTNIQNWQINFRYNQFAYDIDTIIQMNQIDRSLRVRKSFFSCEKISGFSVFSSQASQSEDGIVCRFFLNYFFKFQDGFAVALSGLQVEFSSVNPAALP